MTLFTRREFIKNLVALAGAAGLPLPQIQELQQETETLPELAESGIVAPTKTTVPAGYIKIDGETLEVLGMTMFTHNDYMEVAGWGDRTAKYFRGLPDWEINVQARGVFPGRLVGEEVEFELCPPIMRFSISAVIGKGYVTECTQEFGIGRPTCYFSLRGSGQSLMVRDASGNLIEYSPPPEPAYKPPVVSGDEDESEGYYWDYLDDYDEEDWD